MEISTISFKEISKHIIPKNRQNGYSNYVADIHITVTPATKKESAMTRLNYYHPHTKRFKYVTFYKYDGKLFMEFSNYNDDGKGYAISRKCNSCATQLRGKTAEAIADFAGNYFIKQYDWQHNQNPIFY